MARPNQKTRKAQKRKRSGGSSRNNCSDHSNVSSGQSETASIEDLSTSSAGSSGSRGNVVLSSMGCGAEKENRQHDDFTDNKASTSAYALSKQVPETLPRKCLAHQNNNEVIVETPPKRRRLHLHSPPSLSPLQVGSPSHAIDSPEVPSSLASAGDLLFSEQSSCDEGVKEQVSAVIDKLSKVGVPNSPTVYFYKYSTQPADPNGPLKDTRVFVEVISDTENISNIVALYLEKLGATVRRTMSSTVTLVVFSKGRVSTRKKALQWNIPLVSLLWVEECLTHYYLAPPEKFPAKISDDYDCPILSKKIRKPRSWLTNKPGCSSRRNRKGSPSCQEQDSSVTPPAMNPERLSTSPLTPQREPASYQLLVSTTKVTVPTTKVVETKMFALGTPLLERSMRTNLLKSRAESARRLAVLGPPLTDACPSSVAKDTKDCGSEGNGLPTVVEKQARRRRLFVPVDKGPSASPEPLIVARRPQSWLEDDSDEELSPLSDRIGAFPLWSASKVTEGPSGCLRGAEAFRCKKQLELGTDGKAGPAPASALVRRHTLPEEASSDGSDSSCNTRKGRTSLEDFVKPMKKKRKRASIAWIQDSKYSVSRSGDSTPSIVMTNVQLGDREAICAIVSKLGRFQVENNVTERTTHIICGGKLRTLNLLFAMAQGCWVLSTKWVYRSVESGHWLDEDPFELTDMFPAVQLSRQARQKTKKKKRKEGLLTGTDSFYVSRKSSPPHSKMCALIEILGGKVTSSYRHCSVALGPIDSSKRLRGVTHVTERWLLDSISEHSVQLFTRYKTD